MTDEPILTKPFLDQNDRASPTWRKLKEHLEQRLHELRAKNDGDLDPISTAKLRGSISLAKNLLALGNQDPAPEADAD